MKTEEKKGDSLAPYQLSWGLPRFFMEVSESYFSFRSGLVQTEAHPRVAQLTGQPALKAGVAGLKASNSEFTPSLLKSDSRRL